MVFSSRQKIDDCEMSSRKRKYGNNDYPYAKKSKRGSASLVRFSRTYPKQTGETKYFDTAGGSSITWTGTDWSASEVPCSNYVNNAGAAAAYTDSCLLPTAVGPGYGEINGNKYKLKKIRIRGDVSIPAATVDTTGITTARVRIMLVMDTQPQGAQAQGEDVLQDIGNAPQNMHSFQRVSDNLGRFRILKDETMVMRLGAVPAAGASGYCIYDGAEFSWKYSPKIPLPVTIKSGGTTPAVAKTQSHNLFLLVAGVQSGAANAVRVNFASRVYYFE